MMRERFTCLTVLFYSQNQILKMNNQTLSLLYEIIELYVNVSLYIYNSARRKFLPFGILHATIFSLPISAIWISTKLNFADGISPLDLPVSYSSNYISIKFFRVCPKNVKKKLCDYTTPFSKMLLGTLCERFI